MRFAVIIAGGTGTRLWPLSRASRPKQMLELGGGRSLLQLAYDRLSGFLPKEQILICAGADHEPAIAEHLPELPAENFLGEPVGRDTANAIGFASAVIRERDPDATLAFVSSDHVIEPVDAFQDALRTAYDAVDERPDSLVVFGIPPTSPHTGLGYIERGSPVGPSLYAVTAFREKPDRETAERYVASGRFLWNAGMFVWRASTLLEQLAQHLPSSYEGITRIAAAWNTPSRSSVLAEVYPELPKISIDFGVMEKATAPILVVPMSVDWMDIGSWPALARTLEADHSRNSCDAVTALVDSEGNIVVSDQPEHLVATVGIHDTVIVHTRDVTMVCPKSEAERVKELAARVREHHGDRYA